MNTISFGKLLRTLRKQNQMTQDELASILGVTTSAISKWETGKNLPDTSIFLQISEAFHTSLDELYHPEETLQQLTSTDYVVPDVSEATQIAAETEALLETKQADTGNKKSYMPKQILIPTSILLCTLLVGVCIYFYHRSTLLNIRPYAFRYAEDEFAGTVYEMGCVYSGNLEGLSFDDPYLMQLSDHWIINEAVPAEFSIMKVSFYPSEEDTIEWGTPHKIFYFYR